MASSSEGTEPGRSRSLAARRDRRDIADRRGRRALRPQARARDVDALDEGARGSAPAGCSRGLVGTLRRSAADEGSAPPRPSAARSVARWCTRRSPRTRAGRWRAPSRTSSARRRIETRSPRSTREIRPRRGEARHCRAGGRGGRPVVWFAPKIHNDATREAAEKAREEQRARRGDALERGEARRASPKRWTTVAKPSTPWRPRPTT